MEVLNFVKQSGVIYKLYEFLLYTIQVLLKIRLICLGVKLGIEIDPIVFWLGLSITYYRGDYC